jgi:hypothetical protein
MIKKLIIPLIILCFFIGSAYAFRLPGMRKDENAVESNQKIEESEVANQRDYSRSRKASVNKKPWLSENLFDMEYTVWPELPDRSTPDLDQSGTDFRYYVSGCGLIGPAGVNCGEEAIVELWYLEPGSIISGYETSGPAYFKVNAIGGEASGGFTAKVLENATDGSVLNFKVFTVSDEKAQNAALAAAIAQQTGLPVTEADLRDPDHNVIEYYSNKGCEWQMFVSCNPCECQGATPTIVASDSTIDPGGSITLYVDSGGLACPPYTWEVDDIAYSITSETDNDLEEATLSASSGSCGGTYDNDNIVVTVTVTDNCGLTDTIKIRNTEGDWGGYVYDAGMCSFLSGATVTTSVSGDKEYSLEWKVGSNDGECNDSLPGCGTYSHSYAACVDYYENNSEYDIIPGHSPGELYGKNLFSTCYSCVGHRSALNITYCRHRTWECVP